MTSSKKVAHLDTKVLYIFLKVTVIVFVIRGNNYFISRVECSGKFHNFLLILGNNKFTETKILLTSNANLCK